MIWDPSNPIECRESGILSHIRAQLGEAFGREFGLGPQTLEELSRAVECFLDLEGGRPAVESRYLVMLASRALSSLGEGEAARRLLLVGTGLLRPAEWEITGGKTMWVLDLRQMSVRCDASLELVFFGCLRIVLEAIADVWDASSGCGILGLLHICSAARGLLGGDFRERRSRELSREIMDTCRHNLQRIHSERGWSDTPEILDLDFNG
jgi:hypothetical protein